MPTTTRARALERLRTPLLIGAAAFTTLIVVVALASAQARDMPRENIIWLAVLDVACWVAFATRNTRWLPAAVVAMAVVSVHTSIVQVGAFAAPSLELSLAVVLMFNGILVRPRYIMIPALWVFPALFIHGFGGRLAMIAQPGEIAIPILASFLVAPLLLSTVLHSQTQRLADSLAREVAELQARQRSLEASLRDQASELATSQAHLLQAQKLKTVGTMAAGLAHELNNIITPIRGHAELLALGGEGERAQRYGARILQAAKSAGAITGALLTYTRQGPFQPVRSDVRRLLRKQVLPVLTQSLPPSVRLATKIGHDIHVSVDPVLFQQCVTNLVLNAVDAMPDGGEIFIALRTEGSERGDGCGVCVLEVEDTGVGIPQENLDRIFDPFFTTKGVGEGTGLGLAMVQGIATRHGGSVRVSSTVGKGSRFILELPLTEAEVTRDKQPVVVVLDDDQDFLDEAEEAIARTGYSPDCTASIEDALAAINGCAAPVLLIVGADFNSFRGADVIKQARRSHPDLPIALAVTDSSVSGVHHVVGRQDVKLIRKPLESEALASTLTDVFHSAEMSVASRRSVARQLGVDPDRPETWS